MKNSHAPLATLLFSASLLAPGCSTRKPANFRELVPQSPEELNAMARESELTILVTIDEEGKVFFRKEQVGTNDDVGPLKERVQQVIEKNRQAALDKGDKELAASVSTVFLCAPPDFKYGDVVKVVDAIKEAGGKPIGISTNCNPSR